MQCDIKREAAKVSASFSGKIDKYEYLAGEEIIPFNQKQILEQAKFSYSLLSKALEKQTKTAENQIKNVIKCNALVKKYDDAKSNSDLFLKQKETFNKIVNERKDETIELTEINNFDDLTYYYKNHNASQKFNNFDNTFILFEEIKKMVKQC